jgi:hypothetical protein
MLFFCANRLIVLSSLTFRLAVCDSASDVPKLVARNHGVRGCDAGYSYPESLTCTVDGAKQVLVIRAHDVPAVQ